VTLLIALANERFALSISDRRLTRDGVPCDDEYNKVAMWDLNDARAAVSFTGLAQLPPFDTHTWLLEAMTEASRPEGLLMPALERLEALATKKIDDLHIAEDKERRLSVLIVGFAYRQLPTPFICLLSNWENIKGESHSTLEPFSGDMLVGDLTNRVCRVMVTAGEDHGLTPDDGPALRELMGSLRPADAALGKALEVMRAASRSPRSRGVVGEQLMGLVIPADPQARALATYDTASLSNVTYGPSHVEGRGGEYGSFAIANPAFPRRGRSRKPDHGGGTEGCPKRSLPVRVHAQIQAVSRRYQPRHHNPNRLGPSSDSARCIRAKGSITVMFHKTQAAPAAPLAIDPMEQLRKLGQLRDAGVVTDTEFETKKAELLARL